MSAPAPAKKAATVSVLRCQNADCGALLAYEVEVGNVLHVDLAWTARSCGDVRYFPCPKCKGKNVVEATLNEKKQPAHRVTRWQP
jgi:hypothetical protein